MRQTPSATVARKLSWFLAAPVAASVVVTVLVAFVITSYQQRHADRVFTGVSVWGVDLSGLNHAEATDALRAVFAEPESRSIVLVNPLTEQEWLRSPAQFGMVFDVSTTLDSAFQVGRQGNIVERLRDQFESWYYGRALAPIAVFDEGKLDEIITEIAGEVNRPANDASLGFDGSRVSYEPPQMGMILDIADTRSRVVDPIQELREATIQLLVHETQPRVLDTSEAASQIQQVISGPFSLYLQEPLAGADLERVTIPTEQLVQWVRVKAIEGETGHVSTQVLIDENAFRAWLAPYEPVIRREATNARFYFDDNTRELVLVEPHTNGRVLDVDATVDLFVQKVMSPDRSMPFVVEEVIPAVHARATTEELGITELVSENTTWFYGSSDERKHNIARAAANFYGIVIAPGEEFSFNKFLGEVSAEMGYETGLIIFGGRTIEGVGGGVCQVSTTVFQAAFWAGFPVVERWQHGYRVGYYDDGEGPGMDATVYSPIVDFRFINDTPHHLLIENYYSEANSSLTFKFYSTSLGRSVVKEGPFIENVTPARPDIWELNEELDAGEIEQVDWAVEGADVSVVRIVRNSNGDLLRQDTFVSNYIPWQNIYQYGPGTEVPDSSPQEGA